MVQCEDSSSTAALSLATIAQHDAAFACGGKQQWLRVFQPTAEVLALHSSYANFSAGRSQPPPQQSPATPDHSLAALDYAEHRGLRGLPGHLIPHNHYDKFFTIVQRVVHLLEHKTATFSVKLTDKIVQHILSHESDSEDMVFAATALRRLQGLCEIEGNVFLGDPSLPPVHLHGAGSSGIHVIRKILPSMYSFGADHGDSPDSLVDPDTLTAEERVLYAKGDLLLNARFIGGQGQQTFVECPLGGWRLYQRPMLDGGYVVMDGELRFQGPLFLHGSVHHAWRDVTQPLPERPQHMLNSLKLNIPGTTRFMAECMLKDLLPEGASESVLNEYEHARLEIVRRLLSDCC